LHLQERQPGVLPHIKRCRTVHQRSKPLAVSLEASSYASTVADECRFEESQEDVIPAHLGFVRAGASQQWLPGPRVYGRSDMLHLLGEQPVCLLLDRVHMQQRRTGMCLRKPLVGRAVIRLEPLISVPQIMRAK
jgi:hypothetical protein